METLGHMTTQLPVRQTLLLILMPMLATFAIQRLYLHLIGVHHFQPNGLIIHHLFFGAMTIIPAAFVLAFGPRNRRSAMHWQCDGAGRNGLPDRDASE
jgi:hypothetical protein